MAFVITEPCLGTKDSACTLLCPADCIEDGGDMFYIDPERCIDCAACVASCPVGAIFPEEEVPAPWSSYIERNAAYFAP